MASEALGDFKALEHKGWYPDGQALFETGSLVPVSSGFLPGR